MSGSAPQFRARTARPSVLAAALVLVLLVPVGFLFFQAYDSVNDRRAATEREIEGVAYLRALGHLTFTIADAQAAAVAGRRADQDAVSAAVSQVAAADDRYGDALLTHDRWTGVRAQDRLATQRPTRHHADRAGRLPGGHRPAAGPVRQGP